MIKVVVVDDHRALRDSFVRLFEKKPNYQLIGQLSSALQAPLFCQRQDVDLIILDVCTEHGSSGLDAAEQIRRHNSKIKIIVMSGFNEITYTARAKQIGANAFIYKSKSLDFFNRTIDAVMAGKSYFPKPKNIAFPEGEAPLTAREMEILKMLCKHKKRREIALALDISEMTVKRHISNMLVKTGFNDSVELAFYMISKGWINPLY